MLTRERKDQENHTWNLENQNKNVKKRLQQNFYD